MTDKPRRKSRLRRWTFILLVLAALYVLSWGPVAAWRDYHPVVKGGNKVWLTRLYLPLDYLQERPPFHRPLHAWFTFCFERMYPPN